MTDQKLSFQEVEAIRASIGVWIPRCLRYDDCIYGEWVREWFNNSASREVKACFRSQAAWEEFTSAIVSNWASTVSFTKISSSWDREDDNFSYQTWECKYTHEKCPINLIFKIKCGKKTNIPAFDRKDCDIDINQLKMDRNNYSKPVAIWADASLDSIRSNIYNRTYTPMEGFSKELEKRLSNDGWKKLETKKGTNKVSNSGTALIDRIKDNAEQAVYKSVATQVTKLSKTGVVHVLEKYGQNSDSIQSVADLMDTKGGEVVLSMLMGVGLQSVPKLDQNERVQRLADVLCQNSMSEGANSILESVFEHLSPVFENIFSQIPEEEASAVSNTNSLVQEVVQATASAVNNT